MATRRRDIAPRKDETGPSLSHTSTTHLKATSSFPFKTKSPPQNHNPTAPRKSIPTSLKPTLRTSANDVFKQRVVKKSTSTDTHHKPPQKTLVSTNPSLRPREKRHISINPSRDKTPLPEQKRHISTNPSIRDKTPLSEQKRHVSTNPSIRDKTPLREQKRHLSTNPSIRDKTPLPDQKRPVSTNPPLRDKTPLPARRTHVSTNPSIRDKTPLPDPERPVSTNPSLRNKTPLPARKTHVSANPSPLPEQKRHVSTNPSIRDKTPSQKTQVSTNPSIFRDKTPLPARKTHISTSTTPSPRSFSISGKTTTCQKMGPGKNPKATDKDVGEHNSLHRTPISTTLNTNRNISSKEQVTEKTTTTPTKGQITNTCQENIENPNKYQDVPEVELPEDQESCTILENEELIVEVVSTDENDIVGLVPDAQEKSFDVVEIEVENDDKDEHEDDDDDDDQDVTFVANESSPILEQQEASIDIKTRESEEKSYIEEKFEENGVHEIDNTRSIADDYPKEEDEEEEVEVIEKEEVLGERDEVASESEAIIKPMETKRQVVVEDHKQESGNVAPKQGGKKDSVVYNDVIEETANKLREQTKNRVRALAGAFETVISLQ